ncbi:MAG TPA: family 16 glycosylhydrolase, partial [Candidatus Caenarcaniphilales bacterium]
MDWTLVFSDDFNASTLDKTKWRPYGPWPQGGETLNYMMQDDVQVQNGLLRLRIQKRAAGGRPYTSGGVDTHFTFTQTHGKWELRARCPKGMGLLPYACIWPADDQWPPEIDIVEVKGRDVNTVHMTNHYGTASNHLFNFGQYTGPDFSADFHKFSVVWDPDKIVWYVDDVQRHVSTQGLWDRPAKFCAALGAFAPSNTWVGTPDSTTPFPSYFDIDYVRIYKRAETVSSPVIPPSSTATSSGNGLKGEYYNAKASRVDPSINFDWGTGAPHPSVAADNFYIRWTGQVQPRYSETYTFYTLSDDGVRLWV